MVGKTKLRAAEGYRLKSSQQQRHAAWSRGIKENMGSIACGNCWERAGRKMEKQSKSSANDLLQAVLTQLCRLKALLGRGAKLILDRAGLLKNSRRAASGHREAMRRTSVVGRCGWLENVSKG